MKVRRVLEYEGDSEWVEKTLERSYVQGSWSPSDDRVIREVSREVQGPVVVDLDRTDVYPDDVVPDEDVATCLKVLRTVRGCALGPNWFDAKAAVLLSHAHAKIRELTKRALENERADSPETI